MSNIVTLSIRQKLIYGQVTTAYITANEVMHRMHKIIPEIKINSIADNLLKLTRKKVIERKMINKNWQYKLPMNSGSFEIVTKADKKKAKEVKTAISKSFNGKAVPQKVSDYLCDNIGYTVTMKGIAKMLKRDTVPGSVYGQLKIYAAGGGLKKVDKNPIEYLVLPDIFKVVKNPKAAPVTKAPAVVEPEAQVEMFETERRTVPNFQDIKMGDIVNSIVQLQQQITVYKTALEHVASILEQAGIIESE